MLLGGLYVRRPAGERGDADEVPQLDVLVVLAQQILQQLQRELRLCRVDVGALHQQFARLDRELRAQPFQKCDRLCSIEKMEKAGQ